MKVLSEEQKFNEFVKLYDVFKKTGLDQYYDMEKLKDELASSPCAISEDMGTAYKGALLVHINLVYGISQRLSKLISGTFTIDENTLLKCISIMHLSKRNVYVENDNEWEVKNRGLIFKFAKGVEGCIRGGERSLLEAMNNGVKINPIEYEAITCLDRENDDSKRAFYSIYSTIIRQANELAYAIEKERYSKSKNNNKE